MASCCSSHCSKAGISRSKRLRTKWLGAFDGRRVRQSLSSCEPVCPASVSTVIANVSDTSRGKVRAGRRLRRRMARRAARGSRVLARSRPLIKGHSRAGNSTPRAAIKPNTLPSSARESVSKPASNTGALRAASSSILVLSKLPCCRWRSTSIAGTRTNVLSRGRAKASHNSSGASRAVSHSRGLAALR